MAVIDPTGLSARTIEELARGFAKTANAGVRDKVAEAKLVEQFKTGVGRTRLLNHWIAAGKVREGDFVPGMNHKLFWVGNESFPLSHSDPYPSEYFIAQLVFAMQFGEKNPDEIDDGAGDGR